MNLKQVANQMDVHYQTVYRWVRDGELVAVKVGNRYDVSEAAIEQFLNRRASLTLTAIPLPDAAPVPIPTPPAAGDVLSELKVLVDRTRLTAQPCFDAATMIAGTRSGEAAVLRLVDGSGQELSPVSSFAAAPEDRALVAAAVTAAGSFPRSNTLWSGAEQSGAVHIVHHMPQDVIRQLFGAQGRFAGHGVQVLAAAVAPMFVGTDFAGGLLSVKTRSHSPFSDTEIALLEETAQLCSDAHLKAESFRHTWQANTTLSERVTRWVVDAGPSRSPRDDDSLLDTDRAQALMSPDGMVLVATSLFVTTTADMGVGPSGFAKHWQSDRVREAVSGITTQVDVDALDPQDPGAIVSCIRQPDAQLQLLAVDVITY